MYTLIPRLKPWAFTLDSSVITLRTDLEKKVLSEADFRYTNRDNSKE